MFKRIFSLLTILSVSSLFAYSPLSGCWQFEADYLYLLPSVDDTYFVIDGTPGVGENPIGNRINNDFGFHSGFRVGGATAFCDCTRAFRGYYTRLRAVTNKTVTGEALFATVGHPSLGDFDAFPGSASSHLDLLYQRWDGFLSQNVLCACNYNVNLLLGFEINYIRLFERYEFISTDGETAGEATYSHKSRNWGIGPQFGFEYNYDLCHFSFCRPGALSIVACSTVSVLATKSKIRADGTDDGILELDDHDRHTWRLVPAWHARVGLNYETCFSCFNAALEIGYEFNTYARNVERVIYPDDTANGLAFTNYYNFDAHGLYVGAIIGF